MEEKYVLSHFENIPLVVDKKVVEKIIETKREKK